MTIDNQTGLVLEGGGMRGVFTCGVLDYLMDHDIRFPYTIGVSAGACNGLSYMSRQRGRAKYSNIDLLEKYHYIGLKHLLKKRNILDFDLLFTEFPEHILPYDYQAYFDSPERYHGYRKENKDIRIPPFVYRKYPKMREALSRRCAAYNAQLEMVERMEEEGDILVIRPQKPVVVDRIERDIQKLTDLYEEGYECAKRQLEVL